MNVCYVYESKVSLFALKMAGTSTNERFFLTIKHFPPVINGRINVLEFLAAASDLVALVERLGTVFTPVKIDMQGNVDKIVKHYKYDGDSCLLELMLEEKAKGVPIAAEGILWLNRALLFFELTFKEIVRNLQAQTPQNDVNMKKIFSTAYEGSVRKYHNWVTQQLFSLICRMCPNLPQLMKSLDVEDCVKEFETELERFNITLHLVRCKIDDFFKDNNIFNEPTQQT